MDKDRLIGVVVAASIVAAAVWLLKSGDGRPPSPATASDGAPSVVVSGDDDRATGPAELQEDASSTAPLPRLAEGQLDVKELVFGDGSVVQRSVRMSHPQARLGERIHDWLEARETSAQASGGAFECVADTATQKLVSVHCVSTPPPRGGVIPEAEYTALTVRADADAFAELKITDVLREGVGEKDVLAACREAASTPQTCAWPPTAFAVVGGKTLFFCHKSRCVDLEEASHLIRPDLAETSRDE